MHGCARSSCRYQAACWKSVGGHHDQMLCNIHCQHTCQLVTVSPVATGLAAPQTKPTDTIRLLVLCMPMCICSLTHRLRVCRVRSCPGLQMKADVHTNACASAFSPFDVLVGSLPSCRLAWRLLLLRNAKMLSALLTLRW